MREMVNFAIKSKIHLYSSLLQKNQVTTRQCLIYESFS
jgi:hypothetical protein